MQITAISDTHNYHDALGTMSGETLVHAGDFTGCGKITELVDFCKLVGETRLQA